MTCEQARALLMELEPAAFSSVEHLRDCERCQAFAERLRQVDGIVAQRVEQFAARGSFEQEWAAAKASVAASRRRPVFRSFFAVAALAAAVLLTFRLALLPVLPLNPLALLPEPSPAPLPAPLPALEPIPAVSPPEPSPPPSPPRPPVSAPPALLPDPARSPVAPRPRPSPARSPIPDELDPVRQAPLPRTWTVTVALPASLSSQPGELICPSARLRAPPRSGTLRFEGAPGELCSLKLGESTLSGLRPEQRSYRVEIVEGEAVLLSP